MKFKTIFSIPLIAVTLAACASPPSKITPMSVSSSEYENLSCTELVRTLSATSTKLSEFETKQRNKVAADEVTEFFFLIPVSAIAGDYEADVARYKGEKLAIERMMTRKNC